MDINGAIVDWLVRVMQEMGDPSSLHDHGRELSAHAGQLRALRSTVEETAGNVVWQGPDADAYRQALNDQLHLLTHTANALEATGQQAQEHSQKAWIIVKEVMGIILEILEILAVGMLLSWLGGLALDWVLARVLPLMERILEALAKFRTYLADFTKFLRSVGSSFGPTGARIGEGLGKLTESLVIDTLPGQARAYPGFYVAVAVPKLLSGRPVDWKGNAWQLGLFFGFDTALGLAEGALKDSALGAGMKHLIKGSRPLDDAAVAERETVSAAKDALEEPIPTAGPAQSSGLAETPAAASDGGGSPVTGTALHEESAVDAQPHLYDLPEPQPSTSQVIDAVHVPTSPAQTPETVMPTPAPEVTAVSSPAPSITRSVDASAPKENVQRLEAPSGTPPGSRSTTPRPEQEQTAVDVAPPPAGSARETRTPTVPDAQDAGAVMPARVQDSVAPRGTEGRMPSESEGSATSTTSPSAAERGTTDVRSPTGATRADSPPPEGMSRSRISESGPGTQNGARLTTESRTEPPGASRAQPEAVRAESAPRPTEQHGVSHGGDADTADIRPGRMNISTVSDTSAAMRPPSGRTAETGAGTGRDLEAPSTVGVERGAAGTSAEGGGAVRAVNEARLERGDDGRFEGRPVAESAAPEESRASAGDAPVSPEGKSVPPGGRSAVERPTETGPRPEREVPSSVGVERGAAGTSAEGGGAVRAVNEARLERGDDGRF
ncbi:hypothetical protein, partial [Streptomyces broussonetiae]|uniref:hypothetical protein n=1 Tax=Streptomyces broussonetiae TaxID=2686304 RepID=UPI0035E32201